MERNTIAVLGAAFIFCTSTALIATGFAADGLGDWIYRFQTLISGSLAVAAAIGTIWWMREGTQQATRLAEDTRRRDLEAARAKLPLALSAVCRYAEECAGQLKGMRANTNPKLVRDSGLISVPADYSPPSLPEEAIVTVCGCIRAADALQREKLADLLSELQVQHARLVGLPLETHSGKAFSQNIVQYVIDTADIYARASALFDYARRRDVEDLPDDVMHSALNQVGFYQGDFDELDERIQRRALSRRQKRSTEEPLARE